MYIDGCLKFDWCNIRLKGDRLEYCWVSVIRLLGVVGLCEYLKIIFC